MSRPPLRRILLVDDAVEIRAVARLALSKLGGYEVDDCGSGEEALKKVASFAPDLILLDHRMPRMDGPATLHELRRIPEAAGTPVAFLTASSDAGAVATFETLGAIGVLFKPFDPMTLAAQVAAIWLKE